MDGVTNSKGWFLVSEGNDTSYFIDKKHLTENNIFL